MKKQRNKAKPSEILAIKLRFQNKLDEFETKTLEELKELYISTKMSSTDRSALVRTVDNKLKEQVSKIATIDDSIEQE